MRSAVVDIGSNTVRLVIYETKDGLPSVIWNEKVTAKLGEGLNQSAYLSSIGVKLAIEGLTRFKRILEIFVPNTTYAIATAAARSARDGSSFCTKASIALGHEIKIISAEEEALFAFSGAAYAMPKLKGIVIDMGGRSMEAACSESQDWASLNIGPLAINKDSNSEAWLAHAFDQNDFFPRRTQSLYLVGGSWRSVAKYFQAITNYSMRLIHRYTLDAVHVCELIETTLQKLQDDPDTMMEEFGVCGGKRGPYIPHALRILSHLIHHTNCGQIIWSGTGVREGVLVNMGNVPPLDYLNELRVRFGQNSRAPDLNAALEDIFSPWFGGSIPHWLKALILALETPQSSEYAGQYGNMARWASRAPLHGLNHHERAMLATALSAKISSFDKTTGMFQDILSEGDANLAIVCGTLGKFLVDVSGRKHDLIKTCKTQKSTVNLLLDFSTFDDSLWLERHTEEIEGLAKFSHAPMKIIW